MVGENDKDPDDALVPPISYPPFSPSVRQHLYNTCELIAPTDVGSNVCIASISINNNIFLFWIKPDYV